MVETAGPAARASLADSNGTAQQMPPHRPEFHPKHVLGLEERAREVPHLCAAKRRHGSSLEYDIDAQTVVVVAELVAVACVE